VRWVRAACVVVWLCSTAVGSARADGADSAERADNLYREGKALRRDHYYTAARLVFEESRRLEDGIGVTLYVADCYQHEGELAGALAEFRRAAALARQRRDAREAVALRRAEAVERLRASEPAQAFEKASSAGDKPVVTDAAPPDEPPAGDPPGADSKDSARRAHTWVGAGVAGAGVAAVGIGAYFGITALARLGQSNAGPCVDDHCSPVGLALRQQAETAARWSTVAFLAGGAAVAGGAVIYLTSPRGGPTLAISPIVPAGGAGAMLEGTF